MTEDTSETDDANGGQFNIGRELLRRAEEHAEASDREPDEVDWDSVGENADDDHHLYDWKDR